jgi:processive 1,2-diacylglycerol beta-glucosyltransferase
MKQDATILIVYSTFGDGHVQAAKALEQAFRALGCRRIHLLDLLAEAHPHWNAVSRFAYLKSAAYCPRLYGLSYRWTNARGRDSRLIRWLQSLGKRTMTAWMDRIRPDAVVHTFPYLAVSHLRSETRRDVPTFTVLTDYVLHSRWVHPGTDRYFVATEELGSELAAAGISDSRIVVSGIPVREAFDRPVDRQTACMKYGLDAGRKYLLLVAGAYGVLPQVQPLVRTALSRTGFDLLLVCGKNGKLAEEMNRSFGQDRRVRVFGFVERLQELMAASACLVTKAGGITLTEAAAMSLPVVVYRPLPGQEEGNADALCGRGALLAARNPEELSAHLVRLEEDEYRRRMAAAIGRIYRPDAARKVAAEVLQCVEQHRLSPEWTPAAGGRKAVHGYC